MIFAPEEPDGPTIDAPVLKVFDGDGILTRLYHTIRREACDVPVRFAFIDAPEMEQPGGREAHAFLNSLIADRWLELEQRQKEHSGRTSDRWGRIFCVPYLRNSTGEYAGRSRNIELEMVLNGWAWVMDWWGPPDHYADALSDARQHRRGIWALHNNIPPWTFKRKQRVERVRRVPPQQPDLFAD